MFRHLLALQLVAAVRVDELNSFFQPVEPQCEARCGKPRDGAENGRPPLGLYELYGDVAREASFPTAASRHFYVAPSSDCAVAAGDQVVAVPWVDAMDPINQSRVEFYLDPKLELRLSLRSGHAFYVCSRMVQDGKTERTCICEMTGMEATDWNLLARLALALPSSTSSKLLEIQTSAARRCPGGAGLLDCCVVFLTVLGLLLLAVSLEALLALRGAGGALRESPAAPKEQTWPGEAQAAVQIDSPLQIFGAGFGWILGFITSVLTLQTVVLFQVKKSETPEIIIWLLIYFPCLLAAGGAYRLTNLLCKKQLMHAFLQEGICLTGSSTSKQLDFVLLLALALYALAVIGSVGSISLKALAMVSLALLSPAWTLVKALRNAQETEDRLDQLIFVSRLQQLSAKPPTVTTWQGLVAAQRFGAAEVGAAGEVDFNLFRDLLWHRRQMIQRQTAWSGVVVLPAMALMVFGFVGISSLQAMSYACSRGELADLHLASSLLSIDFTPWQQKYVVEMDISFKQATMVALADAPSTRWIAFHQPGRNGGNAGASTPEPVEEDKGAVIEEIRLSRQRIPRVASVQSQGLRPSLPPSEQFVRFSPLKTLPTSLQLTAPGFVKTVAWSALPRSTISLPLGIEDFNLSITLQDFFLGLPVLASTRVDHSLVWTVFEDLSNATEQSCETSCALNLDCMASFPGHHGCFQAYNNHSHHEVPGELRTPGPTAAGNRTLRGQLLGCRPNAVLFGDASAAGSCTTDRVLAEQHVIHFGQVRPDWLGDGDTTRLEFSLALEVGEQEFLSEVSNLDFRQGLPQPINMVTLLQLNPEESDTSKLRLVSTRSVVENMKVTVKVMEYDPQEVFDALFLLAMPLLPDRSFDVKWLLPLDSCNEQQLRAFRSAETCVNSKLVQKRYAVCGFNGPLKDQPVAVAIHPWTGQPEDALDFFIVPKENAGAGAGATVEGQWPVSHRWSVALDFDGVDSPAAWAAKKYGCGVLELETRFKGVAADAIASSADALCTLMQKQCGNALCDLLTRSLGSGQTSSRLDSNLKLRDAAMIPPDGIIKAVNCAQVTQACKVSRHWEYHSADSQLRLEGTGAMMSVVDFINAVQRLGEAASTSFLERQGLSTTHVAQGLHQQLARALWKSVPAPELVRALAKKSMTLPKILLETMIDTKAGESVEANASSLQGSFWMVKSLARSLEDARQLKAVALALKLASNVTKLSLSCKGCPLIAKEALLPEWQLLFQRFPQLEWLHLDGFHMSRQGLDLALANALAKSTKLTGLTILDCMVVGHINPLAEAIGQIHLLEELEFASVPVFDEWPLGTAIANLTHLRKLTYKFGNPIVAKSILDHFQPSQLQQLQVLNLEGNGLRSEACSSFSKLIPKMPRLRDVDLSNNQLDDHCAANLLNVLEEMPNACPFISMFNNNFTEKRMDQIRALASKTERRFITKNSQLRSQVNQVGKAKTTETLKKPLAFKQKERTFRNKEI